MADVVDTITAANLLATAYADPVEAYFNENVNLFGLITRHDEKAQAAGGSSINVPKIGTKSALTKTSGTAASLSTVTEAKATITPTHKYVYELIEDVVEAYTQFSVMDAYARGQGAAIATAANTLAATAIKGAAAGNDVTLGSDNTLTLAKLTEGIANLHAQGVNTGLGNTHLVCSPLAYASLCTLDAYIDASKRADSGGTLVRGEMGSIFGIRVHVSSDWDDDGGTGDDTATMFYSPAVVGALWWGPRVQAQPDLDEIGVKLMTDLLGGATMAVDTWAVNFVNP